MKTPRKKATPVASKTELTRPTILDTIATQCSCVQAMAVRKEGHNGNGDYFQCSVVFDPKLELEEVWHCSDLAKHLLSQIGALVVDLGGKPTFYRLSWLMGVANAQ